MRDRKFKAWDMEQKKWVAPGKLSLYYQVAGDQSAYIVTTSAKRIIPVEFVGQKDLEEHDVYEGDIVKFPADNHPYLVKWIEDEGAWGVMFSDTLQMGKAGIVRFMHIIGNIHENAELFKGGNDAKTDQ